MGLVLIDFVTHGSDRYPKLPGSPRPNVVSKGEENGLLLDLLDRAAHEPLDDATRKLVKALFQ